MARLQLRLLGGFDLQAGPAPAVPIRLKNAHALLAYLAYHPSQSHPRDELATLRAAESAGHLGLSGPAVRGAS